MRRIQSEASRFRGFTLIELMIVVAVVAILSSIAYPSYTEYVRRSKRAEARAQLMEAAQYMQRFYSQNDRFDKTIDGVANTLPASLATVPKSGAQTYVITADLQQTAFTLTATPQGAMHADKCGDLKLNHVGRRQIVAPAGSSVTVDDCWR